MNFYCVFIAEGEGFSEVSFKVYAPGIGEAIATAIDGAQNFSGRGDIDVSAYVAGRDVPVIACGANELIAKNPETRSSRVPVVTLTDQEMSTDAYQCDGLCFDSGRSLRCKRAAKVRVGLELLCRQHAGMVALVGAIDRRAL